MKFGKRLEAEAYAPFRGFYIQYKELKKALKVFAGQERDQATVQEVTHWTSSFLRLGPNPQVPPEAKLNDVLESELKRVSKFMALQEEDLRSQLVRLREEAKAGGDRGGAQLRRFDELGEQIVQLKSFVQLNFTGFRKILKKYDKWSKSAVLTWFMGKVMRAPLMSVDFEGLLLTLNDVAMALAEGPADDHCAASCEVQGAPHQMSLLLLPKDTMRVKVQLARHLRLQPSAAGELAASADSRPVRPRISSCYFDMPDFSVYSAHVADLAAERGEARDRSSSSSSSRSSLAAVPVPCGMLHLRDEGRDAVHLVRTSMHGMPAVEVPLTHAEAAQVVKGQYIATPATCNERASLVTTEAVLGEFRQAVARGLQPVAQTSCRRSCFCAEGSRLEAIVEEDIKMAPVREWGGHPGSMEIVPFNSLQVSFAAAEPPKWLRDACDSPDVLQVSGFSMALHAVARCRLRGAALPPPHWHRSVMDNFAFADEDEKPSETFEEECGPKLKSSKQPSAERSQESGLADDGDGPTCPFKLGSAAAARLLHEFGPEPLEPAPLAPQADAAEAAPAADAGSLAVPLLEQPAAGSARPVRKAIVTVQPKTLYANERTFLEWIHLATLFAAAGLGFLHGATRASGVFIGRLLVVLAIFTVLWSLNTFNWRGDALDKKEVRHYHDPVAPPVLILSMLAMLCLSCMYAMEAI